MSRAPRLILLASLLMAAPAAADVIETRDGQKLRGRVVTETDGAVTLRTEYGELAIPKADIKKHERATYVVELADGARLEGEIRGRTDAELILRIGGQTRTVPAAEVKSVAEKRAKPRPERPKLSPQQRMALHQRSLAELQNKQYDRAVEGYEKLLAADPKDRIALYNIACAYALSGRKAEALKYLRQSVEAGFVDFGHVERDPDLDGLREEPEYKVLFERRGEYTRKAADRSVERISAALKRRGIDAKAYATLFDEERNFVYLHQKDEEEIAILREGLEAYAEHQWKRLFGNKPGEPLYIVLLTAGDSRKVFPRGGGGVFDPGSNTLFCGDIPAMKLVRANVVIHEFTHALHFADQRARRQRHPIWLVEGLATLFESSQRGEGKVVPQHSQRLAVVQAAVKANRALPWKTLMKLNHPQFMAAARLAYAESRYVLLYMHEKGLLKKFYDEYTREESYAGDATALEAFEVVFGRPIEAVERDWKAWVVKQSVPPIPYLGVVTREREGRLVVERVMPGSPAGEAGIAAGDAITVIEGTPIDSQSDLLEAIGGGKVGDEIDITVDRKGKPVALIAKLAERPSAARPSAPAVPYLGLSVGMQEGAVRVREVDADSPAAKAGLRAGTALLEFNGQNIATVREYLAALREAEAGETVKLKVREGEAERELEVELAAQPEE